MILDVSAPAGGVIDIDILHESTFVVFGVLGFPHLEWAITSVHWVNSSNVKNKKIAKNMQLAGHVMFYLMRSK